MASSANAACLRVRAPEAERHSAVPSQENLPLTCRARKSSSLICRSSPSSLSQARGLGTYTPSSGLSFLSCEPGSALDQEWLRLGLSFAEDADFEAEAYFDAFDFRPGHGYPSSVLDETWLNLGLTFTDVEPEFPALAHSHQAPQVLNDPPPLAKEVMEVNGVKDVNGAKDAYMVSELMGLIVEKAQEQQQEEPSPVSANSYFATDLRPIVLFDGTCNFCSRWTIFLLDNDPLGNLRFASMQSEAGKALLRRAAMHEHDNSEIVLSTHKRSYIGVEAILQIFSRLQMPFPLISAAGNLMPLFLDNLVYKLVSKYRNKFSGPGACRLFDPRFNERFVS